jgi:hypothetical protein
MGAATGGGASYRSMSCGHILSPGERPSYSEPSPRGTLASIFVPSDGRESIEMLPPTGEAALSLTRPSPCLNRGDSMSNPIPNRDPQPDLSSPSPDLDLGF